MKKRRRKSCKEYTSRVIVRVGGGTFILTAESVHSGVWLTVD